MEFIKKYNIHEIGISSPTYLVRHIENYLVDRRFEVAVKGDIIRFRRRFGSMNVRGDLFRGVLIEVYTKDDDIIMRLKYFSLRKILTLFFIFCIPTDLILSRILVYPQLCGFAFLFFILAFVNGLYWLYRFLDLRKIFSEIDYVVQELK